MSRSKCEGAVARWVPLSSLRLHTYSANTQGLIRICINTDRSHGQTNHTHTHTSNIWKRMWRHKLYRKPNGQNLKVTTACDQLFSPPTIKGKRKCFHVCSTKPAPHIHKNGFKHQENIIVKYLSCFMDSEQENENRPLGCFIALISKVHNRLICVHLGPDKEQFVSVCVRLCVCVCAWTCMHTGLWFGNAALS